MPYSTISGAINQVFTFPKQKMVSKTKAPFYLAIVASAMLLGAITLLAVAEPPKSAPQKAPESANQPIPLRQLDPSAAQPPPLTSSPTQGNWFTYPPFLPGHLEPSQILSSEEVFWNNGAAQRRSIYRQNTDGSHILLLETGVEGSKLITRYLYTADRIRLVESNKPLESLIPLIRQSGFHVSHPSPDSPHAYILLPQPAEIFSDIDHLKRLVGAQALVQLEEMSQQP